MVDATAGSSALDPGLGADLLAAIAAGNAQRVLVAAHLPDLRDVSGAGDLFSARRATESILDCAAVAAATFASLDAAWSDVQSAITDSAWRTLADNPERWRGEFVVERIERPAHVERTRELGPHPAQRFFSFSWPTAATTGRPFRIPGESLVSLTFERIEDGLERVNSDALMQCAARWTQLASVLESSTDAVDDLVRARCSDNTAVGSTGINEIVESSRQVASSWATIGNAVRSYGLGLRNAAAAITALRHERTEAMATCAANPGLVMQQPVIWEGFERRSRTVFDETYGAGLFALVAGLALAGEPRVTAGVGLNLDGRA